MVNKKGELMGHKGVSIRKPKKSRPFSSADIGGSANSRHNDDLPEQSVVKVNRTIHNSGSANPSTGSKNKSIKGFPT
jgi:hypothetical protein